MPSPTDTSRRIAETVRVALREAGVKQSEAALELGCSVATLERRLSGSPFNTTELEVIARLTGTTVTAIVARSESAAA